MLYFAYGSNMLTARIQARVPQAECLGIAALPGYVLHCDKRSVDGSGKFTIVEQRERTVSGVLYRLDMAGRDVLDALEGPGYVARKFCVEQAGRSLMALAYEALPDWRDPQLLPYDWYLAFAIAGAKEQALPIEHQQRLATWPSQADTNEERAALNRAILAGASPALSQQEQWPC